MSTDTLASAARTPFDGGGLYFKQAAAATLIIGLYLHLTRLFIGLDLLTAKIITPGADAAFGVVMAYAAVTGWLSWRWVQHRTTAHRVVFGVLLSYVTVSVPVHLRSFFVDDVKALFGLFEAWYSVLFLAVISAGGDGVAARRRGRGPAGPGRGHPRRRSGTSGSLVAVGAADATAHQPAPAGPDLPHRSFRALSTRSRPWSRPNPAPYLPPAWSTLRPRVGATVPPSTSSPG